MPFALHPRLAADTLLIGELALSRALLMNDARFPWIVLVPRKPECVEILDLETPERALLMEEIAAASDALRAWPAVEKINIGALGNIVSQLHIHVVGRRSDDAAWPGPVWGLGAAAPYDKTTAQSALLALRKRLSP